MFQRDRKFDRSVRNTFHSSIADLRTPPNAVASKHTRTVTYSSNNLAVFQTISALFRQLSARDGCSHATRFRQSYRPDSSATRQPRNSSASASVNAPGSDGNVPPSICRASLPPFCTYDTPQMSPRSTSISTMFDMFRLSDCKQQRKRVRRPSRCNQAVEKTKGRVATVLVPDLGGIPTISRSESGYKTAVSTHLVLLGLLRGT